MRSLKNILFVLAAFAWLMVTSHCRLESVPGFEFLACLTESNCHGEQSSEKSDDAGCCSVEKSEYKTQQFRAMLPSQQYPQTPNLYGTATMKKWKVLS